MPVFWPAAQSVRPLDTHARRRVRAWRRSSGAVVVALAACIGLLLATPPSASACTGCSPTFDEFVPATQSIALARWERREGGVDTFAVLDVLRGPAIQQVRLYSEYLGGKNPHGRWILIDEGYLAILRVNARGVVTDGFDQMGAVDDAPGTLNGWYAAIRRVPDTATPPLSVAPAASGSFPLAWLHAAATGLAIGWRRFAGRPRLRRYGVLGVAMAALIVGSCAGAMPTSMPSSATLAPTQAPSASPIASSMPAAPAATPAVSRVASPMPAAPAATPDDVRCTPITMHASREGAVLAPLADGRVLVMGGEDYALDPNAAQTPTWELFDPTQDEFTKGGKMPGSVWPILATPLADGRALVLTTGWPLLFNPKTRLFSATGHPVRLRTYDFAVRLKDGRVLVEGQSDGWGWDSIAELFNPATGTWSVTGSMHTVRFRPGVALLPDGRVLVAGGDMGEGEDQLDIAHSSAELYDPGTGQFIGARPMSEARSDFAAVPLKDGRVLLTGDRFSEHPEVAEVYNPRTGRYTRTGSLTGPGSGAGVRLADGRVVVLSASWDDYPYWDDYPDPNSDTSVLVPGPSQVYDPATGRFSQFRLMNPFSEEFTATALRDGRVLVMGYGNTVLVCNA